MLLIEHNDQGHTCYQYVQNGRPFRRDKKGRTQPHKIIKSTGAIEYFYDSNARRVQSLPVYVYKCAAYIEFEFEYDLLNSSTEQGAQQNRCYKITFGGGSYEILNSDNARIKYYCLDGNTTLLSGLDRWHYDYLSGHAFILNHVGEVQYLSPESASQYKIEWQGKITEMPISAFAELLE